MYTFLVVQPIAACERADAVAGGEDAQDDTPADGTEPLDVALYHPDCRAWEVTRGGQHVAVFIGDYFARGSKRSGAWCSASATMSDK